MKISTFLGIFLFLICSVNQSAEEETALQQTYTPQVIINAPWGNKPEEFGLYDPYRNNPAARDQGPIQGPSTFTIAPNGDIYIVDILNYRVQRFTQNGEFISLSLFE